MSESQWSAANSLTTKASYIPSTQQATLTASDKASNDKFGRVAISSDGLYAIIGASGAASNRGSVYIFNRSGTSWSQQQKIVPGDISSGNYFGYSVSINQDGTYAVVGAYSNTVTQSMQGSVYVYTRSGSTWTQQQKLVAADASASDTFGYFVDINSDGSYIVIGAYNDDTTQTNQGSGYIFTRSGSTWSQQAKVITNDPAANAYLGFAASINADGSYIILGAYNISSATGAAYIFS